MHGLPLNNEYELIPFNHFTFSRVYPIDLGLGKRVVEKPIGYKRKDLLEVLNRALDTLNKNSTINGGIKFTLDDFIEGIYRNEPTTGTQYDLYFKVRPPASSNKTQASTSVLSSAVTKVVIMRPFAALQPIQVEQATTKKPKELVHIILPLSGRISTFQSFMDKFVKIALKNDKHVHLTVVYFGEQGLEQARNIMSRVLAKNNGGNASNLKLLALNETFSRAKGLRVGAEKVWDPDDHQKDTLLFMCDVDIVFSAKFLDRCRWNAKPSKKVECILFMYLCFFKYNSFCYTHKRIINYRIINQISGQIDRLFSNYKIVYLLVLCLSVFNLSR